MTTSFLTSVVAALQTGGATVVSSRASGGGHGDPAEWRLSMPLDRAWVEARFDLGSLAWWYVGPHGGWVLVDALTQATLHGAGEPVAYDPDAVGAEPDRQPLGHVAAVPELHRQWAVPRVEEELAVLDGSRLPLRGPHLLTSVQPAGTPEAVIGRVAEVLKVVLPALSAPSDVRAVSVDLPDWFVAACAPRHRTPQEWTAWAVDAYADLGEVPLRRWEARWTVDAWLRAMVPSERTWWIADATVSGGDVQLSVLTAARGASMSSLRWLLRTAGASGCAAEVAPAGQPLTLPPRGAGEHRDPDDVLAAAAHDLLGLPAPLVLDAVPVRGGYRWELHVDIPLDIALLEQGLPAGSGLTAGAERGSTWVTNGFSTLYGPRPTPIGPSSKRWWRR